MIEKALCGVQRIIRAKIDEAFVARVSNHPIVVFHLFTLERDSRTKQHE